MIQEYEIIMFALGLGIYLFTLANKNRLQRIPYFRLLGSAFFLLLPAWALTILEGVIFSELFNFIEHACYAASAVLLAVWCWKIAHCQKREEA